MMKNLRLAFVLVLVIVGIVVPSCEAYSKIKQPKNWRVIPRSKVVPLENLKPPRGLKPDDYFRFIPTYMGSIIPGKPAVHWKGSCFQNNTGSAVFHSNETGATVTFQTSKKATYLCDDVYMFATVENFHLRTFEFDGEHTIDWEGGYTEAELYDILHNGFRIFKFPDEVFGTAAEVWETIMMFFGALIGAHVPEWTAEDNLKFLRDHMNVTMPVRSITDVDIPETEIHSGDFLGIIRLDGLDPMLAWGMGSHTGHTTITMWIDGELYVCESTVDSAYWPTNGVQKTPWKQWLKQAKAADYNVIHLPLSPEYQKIFNATAAIEFFKSVEGLPYGFHNQFTGWIDTFEDNFPPPLSSELALLLMSFGEALLQGELELGQTFDFFAQTMNYRLGTKGLNVNEVKMEAQKRGITLPELFVMPEQDSWIFQDNNNTRGPSMVCDVFVMRMWKAGGIFGSITDQIQAGEFTNWDAYTLNIFDANYKRPDVCVKADPESQFCQLLGKYRMSLPQYNTFKPFPHMREKCPSLPPDYKKPANC